MKKIIDEVSGEGLDKLMGERVTLFCCRYIYTGKLVGIDADCVLLEKAGIVYETGAFDKKHWADMQPLPNAWYVQKQSIESFGLLK